MIHDMETPDPLAYRAKSDRDIELIVSIIDRIAHDLLNPLCSAMGYIHMASDEKGEGARVNGRHLVELAYRSLRWLSHMLENYVIVAAVDKGNLDISVEPVDLSEVIDDVLWIIQSSARAKGQDLRITVDWQLPLVLADRRLLRQALINMLYYCIKSTAPQGAIQLEVTPSFNGVALTLSAACKLDDANNAWAQDHLQGQVLLLSYGHSDMLWLALSRRIIQLMGGQVGVKKSADGHDTLWLYLPEDR